MNEKQSHTTSFDWKKWLGITLAVLLVLVIGLRLSLMTGLVQRWVKKQIIAAANDQLTVRLSINTLKGDLWKEVTLEGISLTGTGSDSDTDTLASMDRVHARYDVLSYFGSAFHVEELSITRPFLKLRQQDSLWNVSTWMKPAPADADTSGGAFPIRVDRFSIQQGKVDAKIDQLPKDSAFVADQINLDSSFGFYGENYEATISVLAFRIAGTRLDSPVNIETKAGATEQSVSLEKLVIATGNSLLQSSGEVNLQDSTGQVSFRAQPLSWKDVAAYADNVPVRSNVQVNLDLNGNFRRFNVSLGVEADGINKFNLGVDAGFDSSLTVTGARITAEELDLKTFMGDTALPSIRDFSFETEGDVAIESYKAGKLSGTFSTGRVRQSSYDLDDIKGSFSLAGGELVAELHTHRQRQQLQSKASISDVWAQKPALKVTAEARHLDPAYWMQNNQYSGNLSLAATVTGKGFVPDSTLWDYDIDVSKSELRGQPFAGARFSGKFSRQYFSNKSRLRFDKSEVRLTAEAKHLQAVPHFCYKLTTDNFDLSDFSGLDSTTSAIAATVEGEGQGKSAETLRLSSTIRVDSSVINGERIDSLSARLIVQDTVAVVKETELRSTIAQGSFDARLHLTRRYDPANELNLDLKVKDIGMIAPMAGLKELGAEGRIQGKLAPVSNENIRFTGQVDLQNVNYDSTFTAQNVKGNVEALVVDNPEYEIDLDLTSPEFSSLKLQDLTLHTKGKRTGQDISGDFRLNFTSANEGSIRHGGTYSLGGDTTTVKTDMLEIESPLRTLRLQKPFHTTIVNASVRMETMRLSSEDGAILELAVPYADSVRQKGYLKGQNLNLTVIQKALLSEAYFEGILSGNLHVNRSDTAMNASGDLLISALSYQGTRLDTLDAKLTIDDSTFTGKLEVRDKGEQIIVGEAHLPFRLGDPSKFSDDFFERPVDGYFKIKSVGLNRFKNLLKEASISNTRGKLAFNAALKGKAGEPEFKGNLRLDQAVLSGVKMDSVTATMNYSHQASQLTLNASVNTLKQKAAEVRAKMPVIIDLKSFEVSLPGKKDSISVDVESNQLNLAALNDFVNRDQIRQVQGRLDGMVHIDGIVEDLKTEGELKLSRGSMRVVKTGIRVDGIESAVAFEPDLIKLANFRAKSGGGKINASGSVELKKLVPGKVDVKLQADNFKAANTSQYNAVIDLDTKVGGTFTKPTISGELTFLNGFVEVGNFGEKSVENVQLDSQEQQDSTVVVYDSLSLDMDVIFNGRFFVRNQRYLEAEEEIEGKVELQKEAGKELQLFGTINAIDGYALPLGKRFELEEGAISFSGDPANPQLNIRHLYEPPQLEEEEIKIWYIVEGTAQDPKFKYESSPPMELDNIISYTLFGQPIYKLDSWQQVVAGSGGNASAAGIALDVLLDRVESLATRRLGIDVVKIDNTQVGGESGTSITTGWYISPKVFFAIQNVITGSTPDTSFLLEYLLKENLKLIISQGNDSRQGVDLKWNYDY